MNRSKPFLLRSPVLVAVLVALSSAAACNETFPAELTPPPPAPRFEVRPSNTTCLAPTLPTGRIRLEPTFKGLKNPLAMIDRPAQGLVYFAEMPGRVMVLDRATGLLTVALDITATVGFQEEQGLLGMTMHPTKPYAYLTVDRKADATTLPGFPNRAEIIRVTVSADGRTFDPASEKLIIRLDRPSHLHYAGTVAFGPDGLLYIGVGDGGRDVPKYPTDVLLGSILRIDVDRADPYAIPPDNPFAGGGGRPEIYAGGFRNPWRFTFDRATGELWGGDVGAARWEEVNKIERGKNYGWPTVEGTQCFRPHINCDQTGLTPPAFKYPHTEGASVTGGYVYRGTLLPDLAGKYVFGDFNVGRIFALEGVGDGAKAVFLNAGSVKPAISSFGEDASGELYAIGWDDGIVYKLVPGEPDARPTFPERLSQTGCVNPADPKQVAAGLVPYGVNVELWSDGADKARFVAIPDGTTIHVEDSGDFTLPERSVVLKEFKVGGKLIETRLLVQHTGGDWSGVTYEWNDAQTEAMRLEVAKEKVLPNGQTWAFPSPAQCFVCHRKASGRTLSLETLQLNRDFAYAPGQNTNQLTTLSDIGYLDRRLDPAALPRLPELTSSAPIEDRARAYLHTNCAMCHNGAGGIPAGMDFHFGLPRAALTLCNTSVFSAVPNVKIVTPGDPQHSAVFLRMSTRDDDQMPPLATRKVDAFAVSMMEEWIRSVTACE